MGKTKLLANMVSEIEADAYRRGFNDGVRAAIKAVKGLRPSIPAERPTPGPVESVDEPEPVQTEPSRAPPQTLFLQRLREKSDQMRVLKAIRAAPGMRGIEIVRALEAAETPVHERTLRTALARLKEKNLIEQREERWFATAGQ